MIEFFRQDEQTLAISGLGNFHCELLRRIAPSAAVDEDDPAYERIYPSPSNGRDSEGDEDWREHVQPDLQSLFQSAMEIVESDLANVSEDEASQTHTLRLPMSHLRAWLNALNQARLALAARYSIEEANLEQLLSVGGVRSLAILQIDFYGEIQGCIIQILAGDSDGDEL